MTKLLEYPLATASPRVPERFRSMLFGNGGDDVYGVRADVRRQTPLHSSHQHADRTIAIDIALLGPFYQVLELLYFRRDHPGRGERGCPTLRTRFTDMDSRRADRWRHPAVRLYGEYILGYVTAIRHAPLSSADRRECYRHLAEWMTSRVRPRVPEPPPVARLTTGPEHSIVSVETTVVGRERMS